MKVNDWVQCDQFPCQDVRHTGYWMPGREVDPSAVKIVLISEAAAEKPEDGYEGMGKPAFQQTTLLAFQEAGMRLKSFEELLAYGIYFTSAVKCAKTGYGIQTSTVKECSRLLEKELGYFPNVQAYLLMGDVAIKAVNEIARRNGELRPIPAGPTYKIRGQAYSFRGKRAFPSYLQAGPSFGIEKSKRRMIAEDIAAALAVVKEEG